MISLLLRRNFPIPGIVLCEVLCGFFIEELLLCPWVPVKTQIIFASEPDGAVPLLLPLQRSNLGVSIRVDKVESEESCGRFLLLLRQHLVILRRIRFHPSFSRFTAWTLLTASLCCITRRHLHLLSHAVLLGRRLPPLLPLLRCAHVPAHPCQQAAVQLRLAALAGQGS